MLQQVHDSELDLPVKLREGDDLTRVERRADGSALPEAVARLAGQLDGFRAWVATEASATRAVRAALISDAGFPRRAVTSQGYWIEGRPMGRSPQP